MKPIIDDVRIGQVFLNGSLVSSSPVNPNGFNALPLVFAELCLESIQHLLFLSRSHVEKLARIPIKNNSEIVVSSSN